MQLPAAMQDAAKDIPHCIELVRSGLGYTFDSDGQLLMTTRGAPRISEDARRYLETVLARGDGSGIIPSVILGRLFAGGLKLITADARLLDAMYAMDLPITAADYHQPFPVLGIDIPDDEAPCFVALDWDEPAHVAVVLIAFLSFGENPFCFPLQTFEGETFENALGRIAGWLADDAIHPAAISNICSLIRALLNLCLYATHSGITEDTANANYRNRVSARLAKARRRSDEKLVRLNEQELATIPFRFTIEQRRQGCPDRPHGPADAASLAARALASAALRAGQHADQAHPNRRRAGQRRPVTRRSIVVQRHLLVNRGAPPC